MTALYHPRPERWPQFRLMTFFVLVTLLGIALSWVGVQLKWIHDRHEAHKWGIFSEGTGTWSQPLAPWSIRIFGENGVEIIYLKGPRARACHPRLTELFPESRIDASGHIFGGLTTNTSALIITESSFPPQPSQ